MGPGMQGAFALPSPGCWVGLTPMPSLHFWLGPLNYSFKSLLFTTELKEHLTQGQHPQLISPAKVPLLKEVPSGTSFGDTFPL